MSILDLLAGHGGIQGHTGPGILGVQTPYQGAQQPPGMGQQNPNILRRIGTWARNNEDALARLSSFGANLAAAQGPSKYPMSTGVRLGNALLGHQDQLGQMQSMKQRQGLLDLRKKEMEQNILAQKAEQQAEAARQQQVMNYVGTLETSLINRAKMNDGVVDNQEAQEIKQKIADAQMMIMGGKEGSLPDLLAGPDYPHSLQELDRVIATGPPGWELGDEMTEAQRQVMSVVSPSAQKYDPVTARRMARVGQAEELREAFGKQYFEKTPVINQAQQDLMDAVLFNEKAGTGITGGVRALIDEDLQVLDGIFNRLGLNLLGTMPTPLTPVSDPDIKFILSVQGQITNQPEANRSLLIRAYLANERIKSDLNVAQEFWSGLDQHDPLMSGPILERKQREARKKAGLDDAAAFERKMIADLETRRRQQRSPAGSPVIDEDDEFTYTPPGGG